MSFVRRNRRFAVGIGARLTLWAAGLTTLLVALVCAALYAGVFFSLRSQIDEFLEGEIHEFMLAVNEHSHDDRALEASLRQELGARTRQDLAFRLLDTNGKVLVTSAASDPLNGLGLPPQRWWADEPRVRCRTVHPPSETYDHRVCSLRVDTVDGRACTAQSSFLLEQMTESLARFRQICAAVLLATPIAAWGVGGFLARRSLAPVRRIMRTARTIDARDLRTRLPLSGTQDEMDQLTETLNGMLDRIELQVRRIQRFTADASHELRTPLAALRGTAEVALSRPRSADELRQTIEESVVQYERLQRIAEDLLLLARLDAGEAVIRRETFSLDAAVSDVVDLYAPTAEEKGISLLTDRLATVRVVGDEGRLRQVIGNLLDNAIKYTPPSGRIQVAVAEANGHASVQVSDTGIGISAEELPKVFDRFYRADPSRSTQSTPGAGLGLAICRSIVEAHGGRIDLESGQTQGTTVIVVLPMLGGQGPVVLAELASPKSVDRLLTSTSRE